MIKNKSAYQNWIAANVEGNGYGKCAEITEAMAAAFPELTRVRGHFYCSEWGERTHWWLKTKHGEIVDPTALQFPGNFGHFPPPEPYMEWNEGDPEPTGICMECGEYCYEGREFCSDGCRSAYLSYLAADCGGFVTNDGGLVITGSGPEPDDDYPEDGDGT